VKVKSGEWRVESEELRALNTEYSVLSTQYSVPAAGRTWEQVLHISLFTLHSPLSTLHSPLRLTILSFLLPFLLGCSFSSPPQFKLNTEGREKDSIGESQRESISKTLEKLFGSPDKPLAPEGTDLRKELLAIAAGRVYSDDDGNSFGLFRKHCVACHGISGDGAGPNAAALLPYPRDYRFGIFKFTSTTAGKPIRDDLLRTLRTGIPGTAMPSFGRLPQGQLEALTEYIKYLSIRGETELFLLQQVVDEDETIDPASIETIVEDGVRPIAKSWDAAADLQIVPPPPPPTDTRVAPVLEPRVAPRVAPVLEPVGESPRGRLDASLPAATGSRTGATRDTPERLAASLARGRAIFLSTDAQCFKCHGPEGRGDGELRPLYDDWNKKKKGETPEQTRRLASQFSLPLTEIKPRNFTEGIFHGGDRPTDQYYRVSAGIKGTPMPPAGPGPGSQGILSPEDIWNVVNYVRSLGKLPAR
jgi:mono/diheme cytochrome c family protein